MTSAVPAHSLAGAAPAASEVPAERRTDLLLLCSLLVVILLSGAVQYFNIYMLAAVNMVLQLALLFKARFRVSSSIAVAAMTIYVYLVYSFAVNDPSDLIFIAYRFYDIITALLVLNYVLVRKPDLARTLEVALMILVVHGFINWILVSIAFPLFSQSPGIASYRFLFFFGRAETYFGIHRSQGLFWEPGVYQIYLNVALHYFLFYSTRKFWAALTFAGILLTLSTTGVVLAGLQLLVYIFGIKQKFSLKALKAIFFLPLFVLYLTFAQTVVEDKLVGDMRGSFMARSFDTLNGVAVIFEYPWGIGFNPENYQQLARENVFEINTNLNTDRGQTNGVLILMYSTGIIWGAIILMATFRQRIFPRHRILFFIVLVGSMLTSPLFYSPFIWLFTLSGLIRRRIS